MRGIKYIEELNVSRRFDTTVVHANVNNKLIGIAKIQRINENTISHNGIIKANGNVMKAIMYLNNGKNAKNAPKFPI